MKKQVQNLREASHRDDQSAGDAAWAWKTSDRESYSINATGETIFDDRPLRFRNFSVSLADLSVLDGASDGNRGFKIRVANLSGRRRDASRMVEKRYASRGYTVPLPHPDPQVSTFIAYDEGIPVGTVSVRLDSGKGLAADELYREEIDQLRSSGHRLCELTRLAVDRTVSSKLVLAGLFHTAYLHAAVIRNVSHAVVEVNPRHVNFYRRALRFRIIGPERLNRRVNAAAVLLCVPFSVIAEGLHRFAGKPDMPGASRSLFLYGFPAHDAPGVLRRLREVSSRDQ
jgi:hypothetical protein